MTRTVALVALALIGGAAFAQGSKPAPKPAAPHKATLHCDKCKTQCCAMHAPGGKDKMGHKMAAGGKGVCPMCAAMGKGKDAMAGHAMMGGHGMAGGHGAMAGKPKK